MRASTFFKSSTIALIIFAAIFVLSLYWIANTLTTSRQLADEYQLLKNLVTVDLNRTVSKYLQTGDSTLLVTADEHLALISTIATTLKQNEFSQQLATDTQQLQNLLKTKFRALGKLSGNPLALLHNSEKNISALNHQLAKYAEQSTKLTPSDKLLFIITTEKVAASLSQLINAREHAFSTKENVMSSALKQPLTELKNHSASLSSFPLLGIMEQIEQDSDDLSAYDEEPADLAQDALNELLAFIKNYQHEFQQTIELNNDRLDGSLLLAKKVDNLEQLIMQGEQNIKTSQVAINEQLKLLVVLLVAFLFIYLMTTHYLQHIIILKPVRLLRDSFVQLVKTGEVHDITGISEKTELGEIAVSFNQMVANLRQQDKQKAKQLNLVSTALNTMQQQAHDIHQSSTDTSQHVHDVRDIMQDLGEATDTVNHLSQQVAINAETTQHAMVDSQNKVLQVINASASTDKAIQSGKIAIDELGQSVASVSSMLDVISNIADQTNLLALNAAIEAARAGQHGRGFSVVATEVRELASKTQDSLKRVGANLSQLQQASKTIEKSIFDIEKTSTEQHRIAGLLKDNADHVTQQALTSANVAKETLHQITRQRAHYLAFEQAMTTVNQQVIQSRDLAQNISHDVNAQVKDISITLQLVS